MTKQETLEKNGFDFEIFATENEYSARNILKAMEEYGKYCAEQALLYFNGNEVGHIEVNEWWSEFQRKEATE